MRLAAVGAPGAALVSAAKQAGVSLTEIIAGPPAVSRVDVDGVGGACETAPSGATNPVAPRGSAPRPVRPARPKDRCDGARTDVGKGRVTVLARASGKTTAVTAGRSLLVEAELFSAKRRSS